VTVTTGNENLTLTEAELASCRPIQGEGGRALRAFCPFHGSDNQRSLRINLETGHFKCFACQAWGYTEEARRRWQEERAPGGHRRPQDGRGNPSKGKTPSTYTRPLRKPEKAPKPSRDDLPDLLRTYQKALPGSLGEEYLKRRGIPLEVAQRCGVGYAAPGTWAHPARDWKWGRLVFPHTDPAGRLVNLYGRAVGANEKVPKADRHDHLPGSKGYFNAPAMRHGEGPLFVCEGAFDALSLLTAGYKRVVAIFGVEGWRWEWAKDIRQLVFAMDADKAGQTAWCELARQAVLRGKEVAYLPVEAYGGYKDVNEAWAAGVLQVGEWPATEEVAAADEEEPAPQQWALVDSEVLGEQIIMAADAAAIQQAPAGYVAYTAAELEHLEGLTPEGLQCVHKAKRWFNGTVTQVLEVVG
jgi:hypothetical protein